MDPAHKEEIALQLQGTVIHDTIVLDGGELLPEGARAQDRQARRPGRQGRLAAGNALLRQAGKAVGLPSDMAAQHDHYPHGTPKR
jgi:hypothetical protein